MRRNELEEEAIINALIQNFGIICNAAHTLGISRVTLKEWIDKEPKLHKAWRDSKEVLNDQVESQLIKNIKDGKETSIIWYMKTQMRDRGYAEQIEIKGQMEVKQLNINVLEEETKILLNNALNVITKNLPESNVEKIAEKIESTKDAHS